MSLVLILSFFSFPFLEVNTKARSHLFFLLADVLAFNTAPVHCQCRWGYAIFTSHVIFEFLTFRRRLFPALAEAHCVMMYQKCSLHPSRNYA